MRVRLTFFEGSLAGESRDVEVSAEQSATVGRGSHCDVVLGEADRTASSSHAKLWIQDGALYVTDIGSQYGLFVNGKAKMKSRLQGAERIQFGFKGPAAIVTVHVVGPPAPAQARRRPSRKKRPVAMTTVRAVPTDLLKAESGVHRAPAKPPCPICRKELPRSYFRCLGCKRTVCTTHFDSKSAVCIHCAASGQTLSNRASAPQAVSLPAPAAPRIVVSAPPVGASGAAASATAASGAAASGATASASGEWKRCPFCAEQIRVAAIKCRFCGEFLPKTAALAPQAPPPPPSQAPLLVKATRMETFEVLDSPDANDDLELLEETIAPVTPAAGRPDEKAPPARPNAGQGTILGLPAFEEDEDGPPAKRGEVEVVSEPATVAPPLVGPPRVGGAGQTPTVRWAGLG